MAAFAIFAATDIPSLVMELNAWGANIEHLSSELRGAIVNGAVDVEAIRNGLALIEMRTEQVIQFGGKAVAELDAIMTSFRAEIVQNKSERIAEGESLKGELRQLVVDLQAKFLEVEVAIRTLNVTAAAIAETEPSRQDPWWNRKDPWWQPQEPWSGGAGAARQPEQQKHVSFAMDVDDELSQSTTPGGSSSGQTTPPGFPWTSTVAPTTGYPDRQSGNPHDSERAAWGSS